MSNRGKKCKNLVCLPEPVEGYLEHTCLDGSQSATSNGMNIVSESLPNVSEMESCQTPQFSGISEHSLIQDVQSFTEALRMSSQADSHVNHFQSQENNSEPTIQETCGQQLSMSSALYDPDTHSWKMCQGWLLADISAPSFQTWSRAGMTVNGGYYPQPKWEHRINGIDCGLEPNGETIFHTPNTTGMDGVSNSRKALKKRQEQWLTPTVEDYKYDGKETINHYVNNAINGTPIPTSAQRLRNQVAFRDMFPTPRSSEHGDYQYDRGDHSKPRPALTGWVKMFPTPAAQDSGISASRLVDKDGNEPTHWNQRMYDKESGRLAQRSLNQFVQMYPTPTVNDSKNSTLPPSQINHDNLPGALLRAGEKSGARLNPDWVEWLMGWPIGWTSIEPMSIEQFEQWQQGTQSGDWWTTEPEDAPRVTDGATDRVSRLKAIGNGQVPATAAMAWILLSQDN